MSILPACFSVTFSSLLSSITLRLLLMGMWASEVARLINNLPAMWETWVQSLGWDDPLEKEMATHSSILAWRIPWTVQFMGSQRVRYDYLKLMADIWSFLRSVVPISDSSYDTICHFQVGVAQRGYKLWNYSFPAGFRKIRCLTNPFSLLLMICACTLSMCFYLIHVLLSQAQILLWKQTWYSQVIRRYLRPHK